MFLQNFLFKTSLLPSEKNLKTSNKGLLLKVKLACILLQGVCCSEEEDPYIFCCDAFNNSPEFDEILDLKSDEILRNVFLNIDFKPKFCPRMNPPYDICNISIFDDKTTEFLKELPFVLFKLKKFLLDHGRCSDFVLKDEMEKAKKSYIYARDEIRGKFKAFEKYIIIKNSETRDAHSHIDNLLNLILKKKTDIFFISKDFFFELEFIEFNEREKISNTCNKIDISSKKLEKAIEDEINIELKNPVNTKIVMKEIRDEVIKTIEEYYKSYFSIFEDCPITVERIEKDLEQLSETLKSKILTRMEIDQLKDDCLVKQTFEEFLNTVNDFLYRLLQNPFLMENIAKMDFQFKPVEEILIDFEFLIREFLNILDIIDRLLISLSERKRIIITLEEILFSISKTIVKKSVLDNIFDEILESLTLGLLHTENSKVDFRDILWGSEINSLTIEKISIMLKNNLQKQITFITTEKNQSFLKANNGDLIRSLKEKNSSLNKAKEISNKTLRSIKKLTKIKNMMGLLTLIIEKLKFEDDNSSKTWDEYMSDNKKRIEEKKLTMNELQKEKDKASGCNNLNKPNETSVSNADCGCSSSS